ncbi:hypothetical protein CPB84DRAFT_195949 [Gymnopilus junonius]|uniref:Uncharacterized protein n=1 Tax=Gymnopilus junonius TaxID=109634 RepID=A0A9P5THV3_GYMJU|nr:hypothetical protein CPB84DRAFT_195949 [Gymnopilus junonius]
MSMSMSNSYLILGPFDAMIILFARYKVRRIPVCRRNLINSTQCISKMFFLALALCVTRVLGQAPISSAPCPDPTVLSLHFADWLWTTEVKSSLDVAPIGSRAFRFTPHIPFPPGQLTDSVAITIAADDEYALYFQGQLLGTGNDVELAQVFEAILPTPTNDLIVALNVTNKGLQAGFIMTFQVRLQCGSIETIPSEGQSEWKFSLDFPEGWQDLGFDDSEWPLLFVEGSYGIQPWGNITIPPASTPPSLDPK